jgi:cardiolipin synthase
MESRLDDVVDEREETAAPVAPGPAADDVAVTAPEPGSPGDEAASLPAVRPARRLRWRRAGRRVSWNVLPRVKFLGGHQARLLRGGDALFPAMIEAIAQARREIWLATYIFHDDPAAHDIAQALVAAARRGVVVRVVVDGFGSKHTLETLRSWLGVPNATLAVFRPMDRWWRWLSPGQARRLHQKLCVVDDAVAFVGGINLIADRLDLHHGWSEAPRLDFAIEVRGPVVPQVQQMVRAVWTRATLGRVWRDEIVALLRSAAPIASARGLLRRIRLAPPVREVERPARPLPPVRLAFVVRDNLRQRRGIERVYVDAIHAADRQVTIVCPYFYPGRTFRDALGRAAERGVRVRLLLQGKVDYRFAGLAARVMYDELLARGVEIHEYVPAYLHAKMAVIDDAWVTLGSSNIDPLSLLLNLEANVVVDDTGFAAQVTRELDAAIDASRRITAPPYATGPAAVLRRGVVAWAAHWFLRMAGWSGRY